MAPGSNSLGAHRVSNQPNRIVPTVARDSLHSLHLLRKTGELRKGKVWRLFLFHRKEKLARIQKEKKKKQTLQVTKLVFSLYVGFFLCLTPACGLHVEVETFSLLSANDRRQRRDLCTYIPTPQPSGSCACGPVGLTHSHLSPTAGVGHTRSRQSAHHRVGMSSAR